VSTVKVADDKKFALWAPMCSYVVERKPYAREKENSRADTEVTLENEKA
jgi:hypothetical protein